MKKLVAKLIAFSIPSPLSLLGGSYGSLPESPLCSVLPSVSERTIKINHGPIYDLVDMID